MSRPNQESIDTFISITGASESVAVRKLEERGGNLNEAVNAYFSEGDRNTSHETSIAAQDDFMAIDDPTELASRGRPSFLEAATARNPNPFSLLDSTIGSIFDGISNLPTRAPYVLHPRDVREIPIEVKDGNGPSVPSGRAPSIEDVTGTAQALGPQTHGTVMIDDDDDDDDISTAPIQVPHARHDAIPAGGYQLRHPRPSAPDYDRLPDYNNDIEEEMIQAAIEASKREVEQNQQFSVPNDSIDPGPQQRQSHLEDPELAHAVAMSLRTAEREKALRGPDGKVGASEVATHKSSEVVDLDNLAPSNNRQGVASSEKGLSTQSKLEVGSTSIQEEAEDLEEQPLVRHRSRRASSGSVESVKEVRDVEDSPPSSPGHEIANQPQSNGNDFPSEWGGISSEEHDEAVMLEAALFGGIPEGRGGYGFGFASHQFTRSGSDRAFGPYPRRMPRPPSPNLTAQRLIREQQDDEYLASLQADREKELKAIADAEARRLEAAAAKEAALEEVRRKEEESRRILEEEQEFERQLAAKEASLPQEPTTDDDNAVTLLVRMPDGSRRGRRFLKSNQLQSLFDFIDVGRGVKPGTYRLVRPYPRRAFGDGESGLTLNELGLTSKQEALFLELI